MNNMPLAYGLAMILFAVGLYGVVCKKNAVKIIISLLIMENAVNLFILLIGYRKDGIAPVMVKGQEASEFASMAVDPLAQAIVITSIVIGLSIVALMIAIAIRLYDRYKTFDTSKMKDLKG